MNFLNFSVGGSLKPNESFNIPLYLLLFFVFVSRSQIKLNFLQKKKILSFIKCVFLQPEETAKKKKADDNVSDVVLFMTYKVDSIALYIGVALLVFYTHFMSAYQFGFVVAIFF